MSESVTFIVHPNGRATLYVDKDAVRHIDETSGYDDARKIFNELMRKRHLSYRLSSGFAEMMLEAMGDEIGNVR